MYLKFKVLFFPLQKSQKHNFRRTTSVLAKRVVHFMDSEMSLLAKIVNLQKKVLNAKGLIPYHTIYTERHLLLDNRF